MLGTYKELRALTAEISQAWETINEIVEAGEVYDDDWFFKKVDRMNELMKRYADLDSRMVWKDSAGNFAFEQRLLDKRKEVFARLPATDRDVDKECAAEDAVKAITQFAFETASAICSANGAASVGAQIMGVLEQLLQVDDDGESA